MPTFVVPRHNTPHRLAAIALYRALLSQAVKLPSTSQEHRDAIQNLVRNRFKQSQHVHSQRRLRVSFEAGYEAIDYLDGAVGGDQGSEKYILDLLERTPVQAKEPKALPISLDKKKNAIAAAKKSESVVEQPKSSLFDRPIPLEKLSGKRHVPVLFSANHIPVLRIKKPQPESLSRYIRQRIEQRQAWHDRRHRLVEELQIANAEDEWDHLTSQTVRRLSEAMTGVDGEGEPYWSDAIDEASEDVDDKLNAESAKQRVMAQKMQAVVDREQALYDQENKVNDAAKILQNLATMRERASKEQQRQDHTSYLPMTSAK